MVYISGSEVISGLYIKTLKPGPNGSGFLFYKEKNMQEKMIYTLHSREISGKWDRFDYPEGEVCFLHKTDMFKT